MTNIKLTHLQRRRLVQLDRLGTQEHRSWSGEWLTNHWSSSKAANQKLCDLGLAERFGQTFHQPSGKPHNVGGVRITEAGVQWLLNDRLNKEQAA